MLERTAAPLVLLSAFLFLPNLLFWSIGLWVFIFRPLFNLDYLLLAALWPWLPRLARIAMTAAVLCLDLIMAVGPTFHLDPAAIVQSFGDAFQLPGRYTYGVLSVAILVSVTLACLSQSWIDRWQFRWAGAGTAIALFASIRMTDVFIVRAQLLPWQPTVTLSTAPAAKLGLYAWRNGQLEAAVDPHRVPSASQVLFERIVAGTERPRNTVLVVVESLGSFKAEAPNRALFGLLDTPALRKKYRIEQGLTRFQGPSVAGELRELCQRQVHGTEVPLGSLPLQDCLPLLLSDLGYESWAIHGFVPSFFNRTELYPVLGFAHALFPAKLDSLLGRRSLCGKAFPGTCDGDVTELIGSLLIEQPDQRRFIYWLTLNAHHPASPAVHDAFDCSAHWETRRNDVCNLMQAHAIVLSGLARVASLDRVQETVFLVVGDHAPPFSIKKARELFMEEHVPYLVLWPRPEA